MKISNLSEAVTFKNRLENLRAKRHDINLSLADFEVTISGIKQEEIFKEIVKDSVIQALDFQIAETVAMLNGLGVEVDI